MHLDPWASLLMRGDWKALWERGNGLLGGAELGDLGLASSSCQDLNATSAHYSGIVHCSEGCFSLRVTMLLGLWLMPEKLLKKNTCEAV